MTSDRLFTFIATLALLALVGGWAWVMSNQGSGIAPEFTCNPGSTYTTAECP